MQSGWCARVDTTITKTCGWSVLALASLERSAGDWPRASERGRLRVTPEGNRLARLAQAATESSALKDKVRLRGRCGVWGVHGWARAPCAGILSQHRERHPPRFCVRLASREARGAAGHVPCRTHTDTPRSGRASRTSSSHESCDDVTMISKVGRNHKTFLLIKLDMSIF